MARGGQTQNGGTADPGHRRTRGARGTVGGGPRATETGERLMAIVRRGDKYGVRVWVDGRHRWLGTFATRAEAKRAFVDTLAIAASIALLALLIAPAYDYASGEAAIVTPALQISNAWRALALPIGAALM